ncbi:phage minor capsid protein [Actinomadura luteofluorescens]|uniref:phage minor capsid protein n=1 Tax=Actinomadura luteofluorescens TaxID=46163 RepID=UPI003D902AA6
MADLPPSASPALADGLAHVETIVDLHAQWETTTLRFMAGRIAVGIDHPDWPRQQAARLAEIRRDLDRTVQRLADIAGPEIVDMIAAAYERGHDAEPGPDRRASLARRVLDAMRDLWRRLTGNATRSYQRAVTVGTHAPDGQRRQAVQRELNRTADRGLTVDRDDRGRAQALVPRVQVVLQTAAGNAAMDGYLDRMVAEGEDLVRVTLSPHPCPVCEPWEDRILSVTTSTRYPSIATARAAGLWHPRCRHTIEQYRPGQPRHPHAIVHKPGTYDQEQRQRAIERHIRGWKRREAAAIDDVERQLARRKVRQWQAALRTHLASTGLQRSRMRERIGFGHSRPLKHALGG